MDLKMKKKMTKENIVPISYLRAVVGGIGGRVVGGGAGLAFGG